MNTGQNDFLCNYIVTARQADLLEYSEKRHFDFTQAKIVLGRCAYCSINCYQTTIVKSEIASFLCRNGKLLSFHGVPDSQLSRYYLKEKT